MAQYDNINASERIVSGNQIISIDAEPRDNHFLLNGDSSLASGSNSF